MSIVITGSKGLIGSALTCSLKSYGMNVSGVDIAWERGHPEQGDILDQSLMLDLAQRYDGIVHLAAVSRVVMGEKDPGLCWITNVEGTRRIIEAALKSKRKPWLLYASSREVYGQKSHFPVHESALLEPVNMYGRSKAAAEKDVLEARKRGLRAAVIRYSNVYGSIMDHSNRVIPAFCRAAAEGSAMYVEGKDNLFDFTHLDDTIAGTLSLISLLISGESELPPIHLTTGVPTSLQQAAEIALKIGESGTKIIKAPSRTFDVSKFYGDTSLAEKILGWRSSISIEEGMNRLFQAYKKSLIFDRQFQNVQI